MTREDALKKALDSVDQEYIVKIRREIHEYPEVQFDLPRTIAVVKRELEAIGLEYTEKYGTSSVVATLNPEKTNFTIGIRADMDALPLTEKTGLPYSSKIEGQMHACGHDAHTAMLLGTAKALFAVKDELDCRIKFLFQPCEEVRGGAEYMVRDGVMDDIDIIIALHVFNQLEVGQVGVCPEYALASSTPITITFDGKSAHATRPQTGCDALAMATKAYNDIQFMLTREFDPFERYVCSVGALNAGFTHNVIADHAEMHISLRAYKEEVRKFIVDRIKLICKHAAEELGGSYSYDGEPSAFPVYNDPVISEQVLKAAAAIVGKENTFIVPPAMSSEDFSHYLTKKPGVFFRLGSANTPKGWTTSPHNNDFIFDENCFSIGSKTCVQFVFNNMHGIGKP